MSTVEVTKEGLSKVLSPSSLYRISLGYGEQGYTININRLPGSKRQAPGDLPKKFVIGRLVTPGSNWSTFLGWRSFFGFPFTHEGSDYYLIGLEKPVRHSTKNVYLSHLSFVYEADDIQGIQKNFDELISLLEGEGRWENFSRIKANSPVSVSQRQENEYHEIEKDVLLSTFTSYERNSELASFRTLLFSEAQVNEYKKQRKNSYSAFIPRLLGKAYMERRKSPARVRKTYGSSNVGTERSIIAELRKESKEVGEQFVKVLSSVRKLFLG